MIYLILRLMKKFIVDKYAPKNFQEAYFHKDIIKRLYVMSSDESIPHLIFYGPEGSGKKTIINLLLEKIYDSDINKLVDATYIVTGSGNNITNVITKQSNYHIVIEPNNNNFDRYLIQDVVKKYAKSFPLNVFQTKKVFKTVIINNMDKLSYYAQMSLRRTMEKYSSTCRFIMWCTSLSKIIDPLRSRCVCVRIPAPKNSELIGWLMFLSNREKYQISLEEISNIIHIARGNVKIAMWLLEIYIIGTTPSNTYSDIINQITLLIMQGNIRNILKIRELIYNIIITNINGDTIIKDITFNLCHNENLSSDIKYQIIEISSKYEHNIVRGRRDIMHLDAFICHLISILKPEEHIK